MDTDPGRATVNLELSPEALQKTFSELTHLLIVPDRLIVEPGQLGAGGYGSVYLAALDKSSESSRKVAVKQMRIVQASVGPRRIAFRLARELKVWAKLEHPNILELIGYYISENYVDAQLVSAYMANGNVKQYIERSHPSAAVRLKFVRDIATGLKYSHDFSPQAICHGDLKPANVLVNDGLDALLCDFGVSSFITESGGPSGLTTSKSIKGAVRYMSPELLCNGDFKHTLQSDIWAWGCTAFEIMTGSIPYSTKPHPPGIIVEMLLRSAPGSIDELNTVMCGTGVDPACNPELSSLRSIIPQCWDYDPTQRPPASSILRCITLPLLAEALLGASEDQEGGTSSVHTGDDSSGNSDLGEELQNTPSIYQYLLRIFMKILAMWMFYFPKTPGQALAPPPPSTRSRRGSVSTQSDEALESHRHLLLAEQFAPGYHLPALTDPDIEFSLPSHDSTPRNRGRPEVDEPWDGLLRSGERSERLDAFDRRGSVSTQPDEALESHRHSPSAEQFAPGYILPALTDPDIEFSLPSHDSTPWNRGRLEVDELWDGFWGSGKRSERLDAFDCTGKLTERTKPKCAGSFSDISQAKLGDSVVAVKALRLPDFEHDESRAWKRFAREIYVWAGLDHPNVLEVLGFAIEDGIPCLISPWCDNGTLNEYLQKFPDANRLRLVREIAEGLRYLHEQTPPIIQGDVKTSNVFVTSEHVAKICDSGSARRVQHLTTGFTTDGIFPGTTRYSAPEILREGQNPTSFSDVFSFACVALETMTNKYPFWRIANLVAVVAHVVFEKQKPSPEDHPGMEEAMWKLLRRCWNYEPSDRPHMVDVCQALSGPGYTV